MRGNIRKRGESSWLLQIEGERINGKRHRRFITVKGTYKDAQKELTRLLGTVDDGTLPAPTRMTVGEYVTATLDSAVDLSPKTLERYVEIVWLHVVPHVGAIKLQALKPEHLQQWHAKLLKTGLSPQTVGHAHRVLSRALKQAVENNTLSRNVASVRKPPRVEGPELEIIQRADLTRIVEAFAGHWLEPIVRLALATGMRRGELLGLQWDDVNLGAGIIKVERSVEETRAGLRIKPPKTRRGRRSITLPAEAVAALRAHRKAQLELRLALGQGGQPTLVFSTIEGELLSPDSVSRNWGRVLRRHGLPLVRFHALRHTHASTLLRAGVDVLTISRRLGHGKASVTLDTYAHLMEGADAAAAKAIEGVLK